MKKLQIFILYIALYTTSSIQSFEVDVDMARREHKENRLSSGNKILKSQRVQNNKATTTPSLPNDSQPVVTAEPTRITSRLELSDQTNEVAQDSIKNITLKGSTDPNQQINFLNQTTKPTSAATIAGRFKNTQRITPLQKSAIEYRNNVLKQTGDPKNSNKIHRLNSSYNITDIENTNHADEINNLLDNNKGRTTYKADQDLLQDTITLADKAQGKSYTTSQRIAVQIRNGIQSTRDTTSQMITALTGRPNIPQSRASQSWGILDNLFNIKDIENTQQLDAANKFIKESQRFSQAPKVSQPFNPISGTTENNSITPHQSVTKL